jgi:hypothetical protein
MDAARVAKFVIGCMVFGVLMELRLAFEATWARALVAGIAGAVLGGLVLSSGRRGPR